ncbi:protein pygopus-like isoform X2 [Littorina saxatilis]|uniref:Uncharacterized protein n=1 Tax=Littorina saxatilis TaxID=31220 RepID=A0AAN9C0H9_9CAEN
MGKKKGKGGGSTPSRTNTNATNDVDATYYNLQPPPSRTSHSNYSNDGLAQGQGHAQGQQALQQPAKVKGNTAVVSSSSSDSSSSSSTTSYEGESVGGHLALVPRPPPFNPYMMGMLPPGAFPSPYGYQPGGGPPGGHPGMMGGQMMLPPPHGMMGPGMGGQMMHGGGGGGGGMGPPARYLPQEDGHMVDDRLEHYHSAKSPLVMEHPSLRQFVIFMAILFVLGLVALIVIAIYFGRTTQTSWNI